MADFNDTDEDGDDQRKMPAVDDSTLRAARGSSQTRPSFAPAGNWEIGTRLSTLRRRPETMYGNVAQGRRPETTGTIEPGVSFQTGDPMSALRPHPRAQRLQQDRAPFYSDVAQGRHTPTDPEGLLYRQR